MESFQTAVLAAAQAVGYPAEYIEANINVLRAPSGAIDGPSASGIFAVSIAAAILGDTLRSEVCMTGTIAPDLAIGAVGRVTEKIVGCAEAKAQEMIIPRGLDSFELTTKALGYNITVTEVSTLAEAYERVTGKPLRSAN
jgi:predicted S18 family serine protease